MPSAPYLRLTAILFSIRLLRTTFGPLLLARGKAKRSFNFNLIFSIIVVVALAISLQFSIIHALYTLIFIELFVLQAMNLYMVIRPVLKLNESDYIKIALESFLPLLISSVLTYYIYEYYSDKIYIYLNLIIYTSGVIIGLSLFYLPDKGSIKFIGERLIISKKNKK